MNTKRTNSSSIRAGHHSPHSFDGFRLGGQDPVLDADGTFSEDLESEAEVWLRASDASGPPGDTGLPDAQPGGDLAPGTAPGFDGNPINQSSSGPCFEDGGRATRNFDGGHTRNMTPDVECVKVNLATNETISGTGSATAESMADRRAGKPSIPDEMAEIVWRHVEATHHSLGSVIARTARHYQTTPTSIGKWLGRVAKPAFETVLTIAKKDNVPLDRLLFGIDRAGPLVDVINAIFRCFPAVSQTDPVARRMNEPALREAVRRLDGQPDEHEAAMTICLDLMRGGRVDNVDGWALLLARIEEIDIANALQSAASGSWHTSIDAARMRTPPHRMADDVIEPPARPVAEFARRRRTEPPPAKPAFHTKKGSR